MKEIVVVTLRAPGFSGDFELPGTVPLRDLYPRLLSVLKKIHSSIFVPYRGIILETDGRGLLNKQATLFDYGICDGYSLDIVREEKYDGFQQR